MEISSTDYIVTPQGITLCVHWVSIDTLHVRLPGQLLAGSLSLLGNAGERPKAGPG